jgi:nitrite reductase/ring-hydroxylating ferredoxin subunit
MAQFVKVARTADLAADEAKCVEVGGEEDRPFNLEGSFYVIDDKPHAPWRPALRGRGVGQEGHVTSGPSRTDREGRTG